MTGRLASFFEFEKRGTDLRTEVLGGVTTFMTMAYIIVVNPGILGNTEIGAGMDFNAVLLATCLASALATVVMGLYANYPIALAPGMGLNAFFSFEICRAYGVPWQTALGMVFISGSVFMALTFLKVREMLITAVPDSLKHGIAAGIGVFIAFIGLQHAGVIIDNHATLVSMGNLSSPPVLISMVSLAAAAVMMAAGVRGSVLYGILIAGALGIMFGEIVPKDITVPTLKPFTRPGLWLVLIFAASDVTLRVMKVRGAPLFAAAFTIAIGFLLGWIIAAPGSIISLPPPISPTAFKLDIPSVFSKLDWIGLCLVLLFFDLFDTVGTLIGVSEQAGLIKDGKLPGATRALAADAAGTIMGSLLGTSTVTSYIESSAGVSAGARTGLASLVTALLFVAAIFFAPLAGILATGMVTAPALILVGALMMSSVKKVAWEDFTEAAPAFLTIVMMPLSFSISKGLVAGFIAWPLLKVAAGRGKEVHPFIYVLAGILLFAIGLSFLI